jgi:nitroreductase
MSVLETIKNRRSIRDFKEKEIPEKFIDSLIEALIWAPSAGNLQSRKFYFVFNKKTKEKLANAAFNQKFIKKAPLVIVGCGNFNISFRYGERGKNLYLICDVATSCQNLMLQADEFGLGSCWVGSFDEEKVKEILNLPENLRPIVILPIGFPNEKPEPPKRVSKDQAVEFLK